jgi:hypothetical protein
MLSFSAHPPVTPRTPLPVSLLKLFLAGLGLGLRPCELLPAPPGAMRTSICFFCETNVFAGLGLGLALHFANAPLFYSFTLSVWFIFSVFFIHAFIYLFIYLFVLFNY